VQLIFVLALALQMMHNSDPQLKRASDSLKRGVLAMHI
jgi:hypothetical protein